MGFWENHGCLKACDSHAFCRNWSVLFLTDFLALHGSMPDRMSTNTTQAHGSEPVATAVSQAPGLVHFSDLWSLQLGPG